jgi:hypothetical protein
MLSFGRDTTCSLHHRRYPVVASLLPWLGGWPPALATAATVEAASRDLFFFFCDPWLEEPGAPTC